MTFTFTLTIVQLQNKSQTPRYKEHISWTGGEQLWAVEKLVGYHEVSSRQTEYLVKMGAKKNLKDLDVWAEYQICHPKLSRKFDQMQSTMFNNNNSFANFQLMHCAVRFTHKISYGLQCGHYVISLHNTISLRWN
ncbi:hypothetical protein BT96DRAFT_947969 [Gymnopus androsaceus JB14]|uniref:Uncharacterized protein n=1 Tax=Gymnopus androsaceus JB14 TaxID=1447944 RepID=A0A6A4GRA0_9AGAR|nr:hypothetical protein BT96DRAFT_947969 [Gymnopus androsaceus JB14]